MASTQAAESTGNLGSFQSRPSKHRIPPSIYFGGCSFGAGFYVGVHKAMVELWGEDFYRHTLLSGGSAGTIFAVAIALGNSPACTEQMYRTVARKARELGPIYYASVVTEQCVRGLLEDPLAFKALEGRCCIGTTAFFSKHRWHLSWEDNEDLVACIQSSYHIPFYCKKNKRIKGVRVLDGAYGFAGSDLPHGNETLFVGIDPHAEITRTYTNEEMFYPPNDELYNDMVESGYRAMMNWDGTIMQKVGFRKPNYSALYVLWALKFIESMYFGVLNGVYSAVEFVASLFRLQFWMNVFQGNIAAAEAGHGRSGWPSTKISIAPASKSD